jgi:hypothetical protein
MAASGSSANTWVTYSFVSDDNVSFSNPSIDWDQGFLPSSGGTFKQWEIGTAQPIQPYSQPQPPPFMPQPNTLQPGTWTIQTNTPPVDGQVASINGKLYRYDAGSDKWHEVVGAPTEQVSEAPKLPVVLDAKEMLGALNKYREFLEEIVDELDEPQRGAVENTLFGLREAIEGLEKV